MNDSLAWGLDLIRSIQTIENPALTIVMKAITLLGSEYAYLALLPLVFWCIDEKKGLRLGVVVLLSAWLNSTLKELWKQPRPYALDPTVQRSSEASYGLPSGHAQGSVTFWGVVAPWFSKPLGLVLAILIPLVVSFTRLYLGVHFPTDIFAGWLLGLLVLGLYFAFGTVLEAVISAATVRIKILIVAVIAFVMNALLRSDTSLGGVFFGMGVGYVLMTDRFPFSASRTAGGEKPGLGNLLLRYVTGITGAAIIYVGLKLILPTEGSDWYVLGRFSRYALLGAWVSAGAPWLFLKLKLAGAR